jgi:hypothetical protein
MNWLAILFRTVLFGLVGFALTRFALAAGASEDPVATWTFVAIFTLALTWLEIRHAVVERAFAAARARKLRDSQVGAFIVLVEEGQRLYQQGLALEDRDGSQWCRKVVDWNSRVERWLARELPAGERASYATFTPPPQEGQTTPACLTIVQGRVSKLHVMLFRMLPKKWVT